MDIQKDKIQMLTTIIAFISSVIAIANSVYNNYNLIFYISLIFIFISCAFSCFYWVKRYPMWKRYKFIRYLFFEAEENKFNIAPKVLLFLDLKNKKNSFIVKELAATYTLTENNGAIDSSVIWSLEEISNVISNDFYFYAGIGSGRIQNQNFIISYNGITETRDLLPDNRDDSENDIILCHWDIPNYAIKDGKKVDKIELTMEQKSSFDFNNKELIYFYPWNFARKIEKLKFKIIYPMSLGEISMQLFEAGKVKGKRFPCHHSLEATSKEKFSKDIDNNTITYEFCLEKENLKVENLYYIILHKM